MEKVIRCKDVGFDCPGVIRAPTEDEAMKKAAEHARSAHGIKDITPEIAASAVYRRPAHVPSTNSTL